MTTTVIVDKNSTVVTQTEQTTAIYTGNTEPTTIYTGIIGPPGASNLVQLHDVDSTVLANGSVLVYNPQNQKWTSTTLLNQQIVDSGQY